MRLSDFRYPISDYPISEIMRLSDFRLSDCFAVRRKTIDNPEPAIAQFGANESPIPTRRAVGAQLYALACGKTFIHSNCFQRVNLINLLVFIALRAEAAFLQLRIEN